LKKIQEKNEEIDVSKHRLVPRHMILSDKEAKEVLARYHVEPHQFPYIKISDPAIRALNPKLGDLVRVERKSPTAGEAVAYRYVIED